VAEKNVSWLEKRIYQEFFVHSRVRRVENCNKSARKCQRISLCFEECGNE